MQNTEPPLREFALTVAVEDTAVTCVAERRTSATPADDAPQALGLTHQQLTCFSTHAPGAVGVPPTPLPGKGRA
ncbi:hypothetical protein ACIRD6_31680 [Streptomyces sp. NPDC102473]|uniref:hypothetical protein n=1 Tax=Streptomyces sp. NPDC102473 TaxID=3366180 RepID=UPI0038191FD7